MIKNRQEGIVGVFGILTAVSILLLYGLWAVSVETLGFIRFTQSVNLGLYGTGVACAMAWLQYGIHKQGSRILRASWLDALRMSLQQSLRITVVLVSLAFATKDIDVSRTFLGGFVLVSAVGLVVLNRYGPAALHRAMLRKFTVPTLFIGAQSEARDVADWLQRRGDALGVSIIGHLWHRPSEDQASCPWLGKIGDLRRVVPERGALQVVISQLQFTPEECQRLIDEAEAVGCRVKFYINLKSYFVSHPVTVETQDGCSFISLSTEPLENPLNRALKRAFDIAVSLPVVLFVLPPLTLVVWLMQRWQSPGPVFHRQMRSGMNRQRFSIYKYRTMHVQDPAREVQQARRGDSRIYPFGGVLRRTSLDEIPQFLNVLFGDMSVSGPRPHLLEHDERFAKIVGRYYQRQLVKPGITGLAQSKGFRGEVLDEAVLRQRIGYDMQYISGWSLLLDVRIVLQTVRQVLFPPSSAY